MILNREDNSDLVGQLLVAMPGMPDPRFAGTVIYMCAHSAEGAMGIVINRTLESVSYCGLLSQLGIEPCLDGRELKPVHFGGPVETGRGFVLHSPDYLHDGSLVVAEQIALTATVDVLKAIAGGSGPRRHLLALGYAGWGPGQLDSEIRSNGWLNVDADDGLVFDEDLDTKWHRAMTKIGIDPRMLSEDAGHA